MRFIYIIMLIVTLAVNFSGCKGDLTKKNVNSEGTINSATNAVPATGSPVVTPISEPTSSSINTSNTKEEVIIKASNEKPLSLNNKNTISLEGLIKGEEYIEVIVNGEIFDFEQIALIWDESKNELKEKETVKRIEKLENQTLVIKTYQPEGIPSEKIKWKSRTGKSYEYIISDKSLGDAANNITKFGLNTPQIKESSSTLVIDINEKINPSLPEFTFSVYGKKKDELYSANKIVIKKSQGKEIIQELYFDSTETPDDKGLGMRIEDMNFDGYKDIRIQQALPAGPNIPYYYWLWDKVSAKYVRNLKLEVITSPEFDFADKTIKSSARVNAYTYVDMIYKYIDGTPTLFRETERVADADKKVWNITIRELNGKEMKVVKKYTEPL